MQQRFLVCLVVTVCVLGSGFVSSAQETSQVIVNGVPVEVSTIRQLAQQLGLRIDSGRYWYDPISGLWGLEGGPYQGQLPPGLRVGGPLQAHASHGNTGVFVNGRESCTGRKYGSSNSSLVLCIQGAIG